MSWTVLFFVSIGASVVAYILARALVDILRALYWTIWTLIPVMRANPENVTVRNVARFCIWGFCSELFSHYSCKSCKYYSHGYWPWEPRAWHV